MTERRHGKQTERRQKRQIERRQGRQTAEKKLYMSGIDCYNESVGCHAAANPAEFELIKLDEIKELFLYLGFCTLVSGEADGE